MGVVSGEELEEEEAQQIVLSEEKLQVALLQEEESYTGEQIVNDKNTIEKRDRSKTGEKHNTKKNSNSRQNSVKADKSQIRFIGLNLSLIVMSVVPFIIIGIFVGLFIAANFRTIIKAEVKEELKNTALIVSYTLDYAYEGDYEAVGNEQVAIVKGDKVINGDFALIDSIKEETDYEVSLFYGNTRIITTLCDTDGNRLVGSTITHMVTDKVVEGGKAAFFDNIKVYHKKYCAYYLPIKNSDGQGVGMIAVLKETDEVDMKIGNEMRMTLFILFAGVLVMVIVSFRYSNRLIGRIHTIKSFLVKISNGDFRARLDEKAINRKDEISDIGRVAERMQHSLRKLIELDALTEINNRRFGDKLLEEVYHKYLESGEAYTLALADIDLFKRINDTYGHQCGDLVLKEIAAIFKRNMVGKGFAIRWGGEEFLLVFDKDGIDKAYEYMQVIVEEIRHREMIYHDQHIKITITCGMVEGSDEHVNVLVKMADDKLYEGKKSGRNIIVR